MPQLTFNRETCPGRITLELRWDQLANDYFIELHCWSQANQLQGLAHGEVTGLDNEKIADILHSALMVWQECTPGQALRHVASLLRSEGKQASVTLQR